MEKRRYIAPSVYLKSAEEESSLLAGSVKIVTNPDEEDSQVNAEGKSNVLFYDQESPIWIYMQH